MQIKLWSLLVVLVVLASSGTAYARDRNSEERAIRATGTEWSSDLVNGRLDDVMENYADDAVFLVNNRPIIEGKREIRQWFADRLATPGYSATFAPIRIVVAQGTDMAYETGRFEATALLDGELVHSVGKHLVAWRWNGVRWVVAAEAISVDGPPTKRK